jgi:hypothetical protein
MGKPKKITAMPLDVLWDEAGEFGQRLRDLEEADVGEKIGKGPVQFVEADIGNVLKWIPLKDCFAFWKLIRRNIANRNEIVLEDYPGHFAYGASEWTDRAGGSLILLEKYH